jgi:hypothetical protein
MAHLFEQTEAFIARRNAWWGRPGQRDLMLKEIGPRAVYAFEMNQSFTTERPDESSLHASEQEPTQQRWDATDAFGVGPDSPTGEERIMADLEQRRVQFHKTNE